MGDCYRAFAWKQETVETMPSSGVKYDSDHRSGINADDFMPHKTLEEKPSNPPLSTTECAVNLPKLGTQQGVNVQQKPKGATDEQSGTLHFQPTPAYPRSFFPAYKNGSGVEFYSDKKWLSATVEVCFNDDFFVYNVFYNQ